MSAFPVLCLELGFYFFLDEFFVFLMEGKGGNKYVGSVVLAFWWGIKITFFWRIELVIFHFKSSATLFEYGCYFKQYTINIYFFFTLKFQIYI